MEKEKDICLLSIIIPVYNLELYIEKCLNSLIKQISKNVEIIIIDDGSTDESATVCKKYCSKYSYIRYIYQQNAGVSSARNKGIKLAKGKYIEFIDGDDWLLSGSLDKIIKKTKKNVDIICGRYVKSYNEKVKKVIPITDEIIHCIENSYYPNNIITLLKNDLFNYGACANITKKEIIVKNNILFDTNVKYTEDIMFFLRVLLCCKKIAVIQCHYVYRQSRNSSATSSISMKRVSDNLEFVIYWTKIFQNEEFDTVIKKELYNFIAYEYCIVLGMLFELEKKELNSIYQKVYEYRWLLKYNDSKKVKIVSVLSSIIGLKNTGKLLGCFIKLKNR